MAPQIELVKRDGAFIFFCKWYKFVEKIGSNNMAIMSQQMINRYNSEISYLTYFKVSGGGYCAESKFLSFIS